jgi:hypothetical protein
MSFSAVAVPVPRLSISQPDSASIQIAWATNFTDYRLEVAATLPAAMWEHEETRCYPSRRDQPDRTVGRRTCLLLDPTYSTNAAALAEWKPGPVNEGQMCRDTIKTASKLFRVRLIEMMASDPALASGDNP